MEVSRRSVFAGLGAVIVASKIPSLPKDFIPPEIDPRPMPRIYLRWYNPTWPMFTAQSLITAMLDISEQINGFACIGAPPVFSTKEREQIALMIDAALNNLRPVGLRILVETSFEKIVKGEFEVVDKDIGTIVIR